MTEPAVRAVRAVRARGRRRTAIAASQAAWHTSPAVVAEVVHRATGSAAVSRRRLYDGYSNEVYAVTTAGGRRVIVRIAHRPGHFAQEAWAIARCRAAGLPAPDVLGVDHLVVDGAERSFCVEERLPGVSLRLLLPALGPAAPETVRLLREAGRLLAIIHTIPIAGYGQLDASGSGPLATWDEFMVSMLMTWAGRVARALDVAVAGTLHPLAAEALRLLETHRPLFGRQPSHLLHGDYVPVHLLVTGRGDRAGRAGRAHLGHAPCISGILDFESCRGGDPAYDLAQWHVLHDAGAPLATLLEGYAAHTPLGPDFNLRLRLGALRWQLRWALDAVERGDERMMADSVQWLRRGLAAVT